MNKEEFKAIVLKQFGQSNSDIYALMYNFSPNWRKDNSPYLDKFSFKVSEYDLEVRIEKVYERNDTIHFNVLMVDRNPVDLRDISDFWEFGNMQFWDQYYIETLSIVEGKVVFGLHACRLEQVDYAFKINKMGSVELAYFPESQEFSGWLSAEKYREGIANIRGIDDEGETKYVDLPTMPSDYERMKSEMIAHKFKDKDIERIMDAINNRKFSDEKVSVMSSIIENLIVQRDIGL